MLPHEPEDARPVPQRAPGQPTLVGLGLVLVPDDGLRHVPPLPPGTQRAVLQGDVLAVQAEALVEPAELLEHRPPQEQEAAPHPIGPHPLLRLRLAQMEATPLAARGTAP